MLDCSEIWAYCCSGTRAIPETNFSAPDVWLGNVEAASSCSSTRCSPSWKPTKCDTGSPSKPSPRGGSQTRLAREGTPALVALDRLKDRRNISIPLTCLLLKQKIGRNWSWFSKGVTSTFSPTVMSSLVSPGFSSYASAQGFGSLFSPKFFFLLVGGPIYNIKALVRHPGFSSYHYNELRRSA